MSSDNMEVKPPSNKRVYISLPKKYMAELAKHYEMDHGLVVTELSSYLNQAYVQAYFSEWGTVTSCKIKRNSNSRNNKTVAFVRFSAEDEADRADWAGPHYVGGMEVKVKRFVSPKVEEDSEDEDTKVPVQVRPRRSMGLGYILEGAQWLDDEMNE